MGKNYYNTDLGENEYEHESSYTEDKVKKATKGKPQRKGYFTPAELHTEREILKRLRDCLAGNSNNVLAIVGGCDSGKHKILNTTIEYAKTQGVAIIRFKVVSRVPLLTVNHSTQTSYKDPIGRMRYIVHNEPSDFSKQALIDILSLGKEGKKILVTIRNISDFSVDNWYEHISFLKQLKESGHAITVVVGGNHGMIKPDNGKFIREHHELLALSTQKNQ